ncbi:hypothetical protein SAMN02745121_07921 [Nannocystis exedens]|uniref:Uncharacterized protein n=1 Tax=Nannocystis exedens TaxID=54 RepID=A0A1I2HGC7_9BACT|nr:hypothetical protein [Nannocystis exedens]PCC70411.1 hypothetical protein NAEX_03454 [Nannocystis exedens]SFF28453.1 hypothetical protein SAMN02745121_07921 [Nannocystis exedens]
MQRNLSTGFEDSYRRHLVVEQRKAVLETIARELSPTTTLGDIVDAAQELGWGDAMGELSLGEFAEALLGGEVAAPAVPPAVADAGEPEDEGEEEEEEDEASAEEPEDDDDLSETEEDVAPPPAPKVSKGKAKAAAKKTAKAATKSGKGGRVVPTQTALPIIPAPPPKKGAAGGKKLSKKAAKKAAMYVPAMQDDSDAMNLDQAAKLLVPIVRKLKEATMQDLEEQTGMGRRKLRFHIGQLVKHGRLKRHGMGRGTCYTVK